MHLNNTMLANKWLLTIAGLAFGFLSAVTQALPEDAQQEMVILSDSAELDRKAGVVIYKGNVVLTQGTLKIESDRLMILRNGEVVEQAVAEGNPATYQQQIQADQQLTTASGQRIDYFATRKEVQIQGNAELHQEGNQFSGEKITYDITNERVLASSAEPQETVDPQTGEAEKPQRIKVVIQPEKKPEPEPTTEPEIQSQPEAEPQLETETQSEASQSTETSQSTKELREVKELLATPDAPTDTAEQP
ncbi:lipopolysaccharide transport periplasmic protein LptA [Bacterioplanoides sp.]|uniref:lipopolysaccharide transport periplasmic protein LptA n=1 Tax=Bacterioplanoides sp. TaxID=2066072 RepID=UPI003B0036DC